MRSSHPLAPCSRRESTRHRSSRWRIYRPHPRRGIKSWRGSCCPLGLTQLLPCPPCLSSFSYSLFFLPQKEATPMSDAESHGAVGERTLRFCQDMPQLKPVETGPLPVPTTGRASPIGEAGTLARGESWHPARTFAGSPRLQSW